MKWRKAVFKAIRELDECFDSPLMKTENGKEAIQQQFLCIYKMAHDAGDYVVKQRVREVLDARIAGKKLV